MWPLSSCWSLTGASFALHLLRSAPPSLCTSFPLHLLRSAPPSLCTSFPLHLLRSAPPSLCASFALRLLPSPRFRVLDVDSCSWFSPPASAAVGSVLRPQLQLVQSSGLSCSWFSPPASAAVGSVLRPQLQLVQSSGLSCSWFSPPASAAVGSVLRPQLQLVQSSGLSCCFLLDCAHWSCRPVPAETVYRRACAAWRAAGTCRRLFVCENQTVFISFGFVL